VDAGSTVAVLEAHDASIFKVEMRRVSVHMYIDFGPTDLQRTLWWLVPGQGQYKSGQGHVIEKGQF
jgi:hypothetical protein